MNSPARQTLASPAPPRPPRRDEIAAATTGRLRDHRRGKPDLLVVNVGQGPVVVKDYSTQGPLYRLIGRWSIGYECRAYRRLGEMDGVPRLLGRVDAHALALEKVDGVQLMLSTERHEHGAGHLEQIRGLIRRFSERGFAHLDLRGRRNVLLRDDGKVVAIDLAGSLWFRPGSPAAHLLRPWMEWFYRDVDLKWKELLTPERLTGEDRARLRRFRRTRRLWIFKRMR